MVQIVVKLSDTASEWSIIELQGFLESKLQDLKSQHIGDLHFDERGTPHLIIGHHVLSGKVMVLDKPFAVMKKVTHVDNEEDMEVDEFAARKSAIQDNGSSKRENNEKSTTGETSYDVVALVKQKIIFKNRPRPIIVGTQAITH